MLLTTRLWAASAVSSGSKSKKPTSRRYRSELVGTPRNLARSASQPSNCSGGLLFHPDADQHFLNSSHTGGRSSAVAHRSHSVRLFSSTEPYPRSAQTT